MDEFEDNAWVCEGSLRFLTDLIPLIDLRPRLPGRQLADSLCDLAHGRHVPLNSRGYVIDLGGEGLRLNSSGEGIDLGGEGVELSSSRQGINLGRKGIELSLRWEGTNLGGDHVNLGVQSD